MKRIFFTIIACTVFTAILASDPGKGESPPAVQTSISGLVLDRVSGEFLTGVKVMVEGTERLDYTDFDGSFSIENVSPGTYDITLKLISYNEKKLKNIEIDPEEPGELKIRLEPSTVDLNVKPE